MFQERSFPRQVHHSCANICSRVEEKLPAPGLQEGWWEINFCRLLLTYTDRKRVGVKKFIVLEAKQ